MEAPGRFRRARRPEHRIPHNDEVRGQKLEEERGGGSDPSWDEGEQRRRDPATGPASDQEEGAAHSRTDEPAPLAMLAAWL